MKIIICPECGNDEHFKIEKSPFGSTTCESCRYSNLHQFFTYNEDVPQLIIMRFKDSGKYYDEFSLKFSDLENDPDCWYQVIEEVRKYRKLFTSDLWYLIGYSDDSVKNYTKDDIYPIILKD